MQQRQYSFSARVVTEPQVKQSSSSYTALVYITARNGQFLRVCVSVVSRARRQDEKKLQRTNRQPSSQRAILYKIALRIFGTVRDCDLRREAAKG